LRDATTCSAAPSGKLAALAAAIDQRRSQFCTFSDPVADRKRMGVFDFSISGMLPGALVVEFRSSVTAAPVQLKAALGRANGMGWDGTALPAG
jgi:hypothetical protein